mmetsp:Transcript_9704/g.14368  ORF Transcript_9704/g.14368 Transcript_9704/m.14368 type:complete len:468 (+) Transcript_9704:1-1404(+)
MHEDHLRLHMYTDADWPKVKKSPLCTEKIKYAKHSSQIYFSSVATDKDKYGNAIPKHKQKKGVKGNSYYRAEVLSVVDNSKATRPTYWYFTIDDCTLESYFQDNEIPTIEYNILVMDDTSASGNPDKKKSAEDARKIFWGREKPRGFTHIPADEKGMIPLHWANIAFSVILGIFFLGNKIRKSIQNRGDIHAAVLIVMVSCIFNGISSFCEIVHLTVYDRNGVGSYAMDAFSSHFEATCDALIAVVLLSVGCGWTLPSDVLTGDGSVKLFTGLSNPVGSLKNLFTCGGVVTKEPAGFMALTIILIHAALAQWGRMYSDDFDTYHTLEHLPGRALMMFRVILGLVFLAGVTSVRNGGRCPPTLLKFLTKFAMVGLSWFLSLPFVSTFVAGTLPFYARHQAMSAWSTVLQNCSLVSLAWLFTADSGASAYHRFSKVKEGGGLSDMTSLGNAPTGMPARSGMEWNLGVRC